MFGELLRLPGYHWDRTVLVPNDHDLTKLERDVTLYDLAKYPLVSYVFNFDDEKSLRGTFAKYDLKANIVFTARDADIIKTYVHMGLGVGIVAGMAYESHDQENLTAIPVNGIFPAQHHLDRFSQKYGTALLHGRLYSIIRTAHQHRAN